MRILHTSDWNLGKRFYNRDRSGEQKAVLLEIVNIANEQKSEIVLIAGNVFDGFKPTPRSIETFSDILGKLVAGGKRAVLVIAGENDDTASLKELIPFAERQGVTIITGPDDTAVKTNPSFFVKVTAAEKGIVEIANERGEVAIISVVPYAAKEQGGPAVKAPYGSVSENENAARLALIRANRYEIGDGAGRINWESLEALSYIALGSETPSFELENKIFAAGGIMDYGFDEAGRYVIAAELNQSGLISAEKIALTVPKKLKNVIATDISSAFELLDNHKDVYTRLILSSDKPVKKQTADELRSAYPLLVEIVFNGYKEDSEPSRLADPADPEVFSSFIDRAGVENAGAFRQLFAALMEE